ncbi:hypothetical protein C1Y63_11710 [Corynebacterium sp. 13CS0277]|uniref:peptidylprolyl isomerase n=1 Tax=Corynebacterium sp. 13CS0277 TaxID=2071994 RepID=UPI000D02BBF4|nr:peptidylprolyl isomerase [Corynebacterium sp. 13CS0277]PRQ10391.1 hypothetical protein C1Y63_11710 [Corynebacterium sp. 13CS0277]
MFLKIPRHPRPGSSRTPRRHARWATVGAAGIALLSLSGCSFVADKISAHNSPSSADTNCEYVPTSRAAREVSLPSATAPTSQVDVTLHTNQGDIAMTLDPKKAPCAVNAITHLAEEHYYDDTVCHRLTQQGLFVLQCGDPSGSGAGGPGFSFHDEYPVNQSNSTGLYTAGTVAMANSGRNTNGSQFFIVYKDSKLAPNYTVLGSLSNEGLATVEKIAAQGTVGNASDGAPAQQVLITSVDTAAH